VGLFLRRSGGTGKRIPLMNVVVKACKLYIGSNPVLTTKN